jgi:hypothetical protein
MAQPTLLRLTQTAEGADRQRVVVALEGERIRQTASTSFGFTLRALNP